MFRDELKPEEYLIVIIKKSEPMTYKQYVSKRTKELAQSHKHIHPAERMKILAQEWRETKAIKQANKQ